MTGLSSGEVALGILRKIAAAAADGGYADVFTGERASALIDVTVDLDQDEAALLGGLLEKAMAEADAAFEAVDFIEVEARPTRLEDLLVRLEESVRRAREAKASRPRAEKAKARDDR